ncbi:MAG: hypothetical protein RBU23_09150 [Candidatus Auribacterota bacterium]|jgi:tetratricopeptide (TPR) repeat protein|nr:hypothetical protein [Candidatus Auribacterota bacterium]
MAKAGNKNVYIVVALIIVVVVCAIIYGVLNKIDTPLLPSTQMQDLLNKALVTRKPMIFFIYLPDEKNVWDETLADQQFAGTFEKILTYKEPVSFFLKTKWNQQIKSLTVPAILAVDYRNRFIRLQEGIPSSEELRSIFADVLLHHELMVAQDIAAKKELDKLKSIVENQQYIDAMDRLRTFLMVYENTECEVQARDLLNDVSVKPQVIEYLRSNRDAANRKVLLHKAQEDFRYKRYFNADRAISFLVQHFPNSEEAQAASEIKQQIDTIARDEFREATDLYNRKQYYQAYEKYLSLHQKFQGTHWDVYISGKIQQMDADPAFATYKERLVKDREAEGIFNRAEQLFEQEQWDQAEQFYNTVLRFHPKSRYAFRSKQRIEEMNTLRYSKPSKKTDDTSIDAKEE